MAAKTCSNEVQGQSHVLLVVRHLRTHGVMRGVIASGDTLDADALVAKARAIRKMEGTDLASVVTTKAAYGWDADEPKNQTGDELLPGEDKAAEEREPLHVVAYDFGIKREHPAHADAGELPRDRGSGEDDRGRAWR